MNKSINKILFWAPRILCIIFALFTAIFAIDVFNEDYSFWKTILAFVMHLIPSGIIVLVLIVSWRWDWIGGILFMAMPIFYIYWAWGRFPISVYLIMCLPMVLISILFFINWKIKIDLQNK